LLQIAFVEFTHAFFSINENSTPGASQAFGSYTLPRAMAAFGHALASL